MKDQFAMLSSEKVARVHPALLARNTASPILKKTARPPLPITKNPKKGARFKLKRIGMPKSVQRKQIVPGGEAGCVIHKQWAQPLSSPTRKCLRLYFQPSNCLYVAVSIFIVLAQTSQNLYTSFTLRHLKLKPGFMPS